MTKLVYVNPRQEDNCHADLEVLSKYMSSHYIKCNTYEVHNSYFIAIDNVDDDTIDMLNRAKLTIYHIDNIVGYVSIKFKDEKSRDLVFKALKGEVA